MNGTFTIFLFLSVSLIVAFDDDLCYQDGKPNNCFPRNAKCPLWHNSTLCCNWAKFNYMRMSHPTGSRSMVHYDATYIIAQAVGLSASEAYWIAAYTEGTDQGQLVPLGKDGAIVQDLAYYPVDLTGLNRYHLCAGGSDFHYPLMTSNISDYPPFQPPLDDPVHHGHLTHVGRWQRGERAKLCISGLTSSNNTEPLPNSAWTTGIDCYCAGNEAQAYDDKNGRCSRRSLSWDPSFIGLLHWQLDTYLGDTRVTFKHSNASDEKFDPKALAKYELHGCPADEFEEVVWFDEFDAYVANGTGRFPLPCHATDHSTSVQTSVPVWLARMGIFLHHLQDVISHDSCYRNSHIAGPDKDGYFKLVYSTRTGDCDTANHVLHHYWETAQPRLYPSTSNALQITWSYLAKFVVGVSRIQGRTTAKGAVRPTLAGLVGTDEQPGELLVALQQADAGARLAHMQSITAKYNLTQLPGF